MQLLMRPFSVSRAEIHDLSPKTMPLLKQQQLVGIKGFDGHLFLLIVFKARGCVKQDGLIKDGDLAYLHVHADEDRLSFDAEFPSAGSYRLFLQFDTGGQVRTAPFTITAEETTS